MAPRLSLGERVEIQAGIARDEDCVEIAARLERAASTVSREITRGGGRPQYQATAACRAACRRGARPKAAKLATHEALATWVTGKLDSGWSPVAVAAALRNGDGPPADVGNGTQRRCCAETIYAAVYAGGKHGLAKDQWRKLPSRRRHRKARSRAEQARRRNQLGDIRPVATRPPAAAARTEPGHWEGDLIMGAMNRSALVTLVERATRYTLVGDLPGGHGADSVFECLVDLFHTNVPQHLQRSLTWDQGREMARWDDFETAMAIPVYFCDPHSPWQRPTNENTNRLLRRWLPKGSDLNRVNRDDLATITTTLNTMPRYTLHWSNSSAQYALECNHP